MKKNQPLIINRSPALLLGIASLVFALLSAPIAPAQVIYSDSFSGSAVALHATTVDVSNGTLGGTTNATWVAGSTYQDNGVLAATARTLALLPFTPQSGHKYELSATISVPSGFLGIGFCTNSGFTGSPGGQNNNNAYRMLTVPALNYGMMFINAGVSSVVYSTYYSGTSTLNAATPLPAAEASYYLKIVLDTTSTDWTLAYFIDGGQVTNYTFTGSAPINAVGFTSGNAVAGSTIDDFLLEIPTPVAYAGKVWVGDGGANLWDINTSASWLTNSLLGSPDVYHDGDTVVFNNTATNLSVNITTTVSPASVAVSSLKNYTLSGAGSIAGTNSLSKDGTGNLLIANANAYSGGTTLAGTGFLGLSNANALGTGALNLNSARTDNLPTVILSGGITVSNPIVGDSTTGRESIYSTNGNNSLTGPITINGNGNNAVIFQNADTNSVFTISGDIVATNFSRTISLRGDAGALGVINGRVTMGTGDAAIFQTLGDANWKINSTGNSWGQARISQGTTGAGGFTLGVTDALNPAEELQFDSDALGSLDLAGFNQTLRGVTSAGTVGFIGNSSTSSDSVLKINGQNGMTFAGTLVDALGSGTKTLSVEILSGLQKFSGNNTYTGPTIVHDSGQLTIVSPGSLAAGSVVTVQSNATLRGNGVINGPVAVQNGGTIIGGLSTTAGILTVGSLTLGATAADAQTISVAVNNAGTVTGPIHVSGAMANNGMTTILITSTNGYLVGTYTGLITYTGGSIDTNGFVLVLPPRVEGDLVFNSGSIDLNITSAVSDAPKWDGTINGNWDTTTTNWVLITGGTPTTYVDANLPYYSGEPALFDDTLTGTPNVVLNTTVTPQSVTFANSSAAYSVTGTGGIAGTGGISKSGTGSVTLDTSNTFTGNVTANSGVLVLNGVNAYGSTTLTGNAIVRAGQNGALGTGIISVAGLQTDSCRIELTGGITVTNSLSLRARNYTVSYPAHILNVGGVNTLNPAADIEMAAGGNAISLQSDSGRLILTKGMFTLQTAPRYLALLGAGDGEVQGSIGNNMGLAKEGAGTWTLTGSSSLPGPTFVSGGALVVNGIFTNAANTVTVLGGTLAGGGTIAGPVTLQAGGTLSPGNSVGTLTLSSNLTLNAGSTNIFEVNGSTLAKDVVAVGGSVAYGGVLKIVPTGSFSGGQSFILFSGAGATNASNFASIEGTPGSGKVFNFTNGVLSVVSTSVTPVQLTNSLSGSTLTFTWPAGQGWTLQSETNSLSVGLTTNSINWGTVAGGIDGSNSISINPANPTVFYRLYHP